MEMVMEMVRESLYNSWQGLILLLTSGACTKERYSIDGKNGAIPRTPFETSSFHIISLPHFDVQPIRRSCETS